MTGPGGRCRYDADALLSWLADSQTQAVIPAKKNRLFKRSFDENLYKDRNKVERYFNKLKQYRRVATRYDKTASCFAGFIYIASTLILLA
ncbi:transposase [Fibrisoma montanum]|uniref:transposase n=1 Tax=Fibrisoma montanum TaxID=2305895 RepID=UPI0035B5B3C6